MSPGLCIYQNLTNFLYLLHLTFNKAWILPTERKNLQQPSFLRLVLPGSKHKVNPKKKPVISTLPITSLLCIIISGYKTKLKESLTLKAGMSERRNSGMAEQWNGRMTEQRGKAQNPKRRNYRRVGWQKTPRNPKSWNYGKS